MIRTKIVATMGPACCTPQLLYELFEVGVNVCRINFSHGSLEEHSRMLCNIREAALRWKEPIAILGDLGGPKIRLGKVADEGGSGGMPIAAGEECIIQRDSIEGGNSRVSTTYPRFVDDVKTGDRILVEDGMLRFRCVSKESDQMRCACTVGGVLKSAKGINLPDTHVNIPSITERDWECVQWAIDNDLDYLALSFVRSADELRLLHQRLSERNSDIKLIAKIEKAEALRDIDAILEQADGLMVARGDLGVEIDLADVPIIQKDLVRRCRTAGKPVIVATQMLQSMIGEASPTRAEVSDVANAIFDGTDAVMLSGETSVGKYPSGAVKMMKHIARQTEEYLADSQRDSGPPEKLKGARVSAAIARGVWQMVQDLQVKLVVMRSRTGHTARIFSKTRFPVPILALSNDRRGLRRMALHYGVIPLELNPSDELDYLVPQVDRLVNEGGYAAVGDRIVIVAGASPRSPATLNGVILHTVGEEWLPSPSAEEAQPQASFQVGATREV